MKKNTIISLVMVLVLVVIGASIYFLRPCPYSKSTKVMSDDGKMSLYIKEAALPDHISVEDVEVEYMEADKYPVVFEDNASFAVYSMAPHGVAFLEPIDFEIEVEIEEDAIPALYHFSEYEISRVNDAEVFIDETNKVAIIKGQTDHFSHFYVMKDAFSVTLTAPEKANVGERFQVSARTKKERRAVKWILADTRDEHSNNQFLRAMIRQWKEAAGISGRMTGNVEVGELKFKDPWELQGKFTANPGEIVQPTLIENAPARTKVQSAGGLMGDTGSEYNFNGNFECKSPGLATVIYDVEIYAEVEMDWKINPPFEITMEDAGGPFKVKRQSLTECVAAPPEGDDDDDDDDDDEGDDDDGNDDDDDQGDDDEANDDDDDDGEGEGEGEGEGGDCPDCEALEAELENLKKQKEELEKEIKEAEDDVKTAEMIAEIIDEELDKVIKDAGCDPNQDPGGGANKAGESSGKVSSRNRPFFCPNEDAAERLSDALKEFWEEHESPSKARHKLNKLKKKMKKLDDKIKKIQKQLAEDCPCEDDVAIANAIQLEGEIKLGDPCVELVEVLNLTPSVPENVAFDVGKGLAPWLKIEPSSGELPMDIEVKYNCDELAKLEVGEYKTGAKVNIYNKEDKKVKAIPVNMFLGILLVEGNDDDDDDDYGGGGVVMGPTEIDFVYDHASPVCPLPVDPINVTGPVGGTWVLNTAPPIWLGVKPTSGSIPATINLNFPCRLNQYTNQSQSVDLDFTVTKPDGSTEDTQVKVNGEFTNF